MNFPLANTGSLAILIAGFFFGYFLEVSGLGSPRKLNAQFTLRDWTVFAVIAKFLAHLDAKASEPEAPRGPRSRAPPQRGQVSYNP